MTRAVVCEIATRRMRRTGRDPGRLASVSFHDARDNLAWHEIHHRPAVRPADRRCQPVAPQGFSARRQERGPRGTQESCLYRVPGSKRRIFTVKAAHAAAYAPAPVRPVVLALVSVRRILAVPRPAPAAGTTQPSSAETPRTAAPHTGRRDTSAAAIQPLTPSAPPRLRRCPPRADWRSRR